MTSPPRWKPVPSVAAPQVYWQVSSDASSLLGQVQRLRVAGAERFIVPNLPPLA